MKVIITKEQFKRNILKEDTDISSTEICVDLLKEASDHLADALRLIESATQYAYEEEDDDLINELVEIRRDLAYGANKVWETNEDYANIIGRLNDIIKKYD